jgi:riboflavin biosynthesis pyrimidine reductase
MALNMVATVDGRATIDGRSGPIGDAADRELFHGLRTQVDAVMAGARTMEVEHYGRLVKSDALAERREREGLAPQPLAVIVSGSLAFNPEAVPLLQEPEAAVAIITRAEGSLEGIDADVTWIRVEEGPDGLRTGLERLRAEHGVRSVLCEGGPTLNRSLLEADLVDQLFLSLAPRVAGGQPPLPIVNGPAFEDPFDLWLLSCHEAEDSLFLRYELRRD